MPFRYPFLLLILCWAYPSTLLAQTPSEKATHSLDLQQPITLSRTEYTLEVLLEELSQQAGLHFSFNPAVVPLTKPIRLLTRQLSLAEALQTLLAGTDLTYTQLDNQIIIRQIIIRKSIFPAAQKHTISGYVREKGSQELLLGANIYASELKIGTSSNTYGFYSLTLPEADSITLVFSYVGYQPFMRRIAFRQDQLVNVELVSDLMLQEVVVEGQREKVSETSQMSTLELPIRQVKAVPTLLGEKDVLKVLQLMPGVQKGSEGSSGLYVRGGGPDQNLIILDDATVYNASHLFGFFSVFNGDALKSIELTKGGFPARYGGRLSSVLEMTMKEGNKERLHGEGGMGLIASRLTLEGPLQKGKSSFLLSGRRTYADLLARPFLKNPEVGYYFYDLNAKLNYDFGRKNKLYVSGYFGKDKYFFSERQQDNSTVLNGLNWGNQTGTLRWNHLFSEKLFTNTALIFSHYSFDIYQGTKGADNQEYRLSYYSGIRDISFKQDWDFYPAPNHALKAGLLSTYHQFKPNAFVTKDEAIALLQTQTPVIDVVESALYLEDTYRPFSRLSINAGFRLSHYATQGQQYWKPEPRIAASYRIGPDLALKGSYALMNQYVHLLSNTGVGMPTDLWVPSTSRVAPQQSQQVALGAAKDFTEKGLQLTLEGYYKKMDHIVGYREGANFLLLEQNLKGEVTQVPWEDNVTAGQGWSYGMEFLIQKKLGRLSGWVGYTLSWTQQQFDELNFGKKFYARYDRRHDLSLVGIYELSPRITLSGTWVYGTGNAITLPVSSYWVEAHRANQADFVESGNGTYSNTWFGSAKDYGDKNSFRMAPYHRLDVGIQFRKAKKHYERTWEINLYNAYNRQNPFFYSSGTQYDKSTGRSRFVIRQVSLFPIIPSVSYSFKF